MSWLYTSAARPGRDTTLARAVVAAGAVTLVLQGCGDSDAEDDISCAVTTSTGNVTLGSGLPGDPAAPEPSLGFN